MRPFIFAVLALFSSAGMTVAGTKKGLKKKVTYYMISLFFLAIFVYFFQISLQDIDFLKYTNMK